MMDAKRSHPGTAERRATRAAAAAIGAVLAFLGACTQAEHGASAPDGTLEIVLETDLQLPKDFDRITVQVTQKSQSLLSVDKDVGSGALLLPATFVVKSTSDASPVTIHAVGYKDHAPIVERDAVTPIPADQSGVLHLALDYLCLGTAQADPDGGVSSTCAGGLTCVLGQCATATVAPSAVVATSDHDASVDAGPDGCFDVATCFGSAMPATVDTTSCTVTLPSGTDPATVNVGLQFPVGGDGVCGATACWVSLTGWTLKGSQLQLPAAACTNAASQGAQIVVSAACYTEASDMTPCGPGSSVPTVALQPPPSPLGMSCDPPGSQACGQCGTQTRTCKSGVWSPWNACMGEGPCAPGATQSCGVGGTQTCSADCEWGACGCTGSDLACGAPGTCVSSTDLHTCGSCANDCTALPHVAGATTCSAGKCVVPATSCAPGYGDCNSDPTDGCETALNVADHCNACTTACPTTAPTCDSSTGTPHCVSTCTGTTCGSSCVSVSTNPNDCGSCGKVCPSPAHGQATCVGGSCAASCNSGYTACSGACVDFTSDASNCGTCGHACATGSSCVSGACTCAGATTQSCGNCGTQTAVCNNGTLTWSACSGQGACMPGATEACDTNGSASCTTACAWGGCVCHTGYSLCSGACMNYQQDTANCGGCAKVCSLANAAVACTSGGCTVASCTTGFANCDGTAANGCEVNLNTDAKNCGKCTAACSLANATSTCSSGSCAVNACTTGFANCDGKAANGCEANLSTDSNNCGACGTVCGAGSSCQGGTCKCSGACQQVVVETAYQPVGIAVDSTNIYWTDVNTNGTYTYPSQYVTSTPQYSGVIMEAPIGGGTPLMLAWDMVAPEGITVDATSVYWTNVASGQIMKTTIGKQMVPTNLYTDSSPPHAIAVNATNVFWNCEDGTVKTVPLAGASTARQVNFGSLPYSGDTPGGLTVDATNVYYAEDGNIWQLAANSSLGKGLSLASGLTNPFGIAVDAHNVYWTNFNTAAATDSVMQIPISGASSVTVAPAQQEAIDIAVDATSVYWTDVVARSVMKAPIGGGTPITLATLPAGQAFSFENVPLGLAVDSTSVYWLTSSVNGDAGAGTGSITKVAK